MMVLKVFDKAKPDKWDEFVSNSFNGTIFHEFKFLSYHQNKFTENEHPLAFFNGQEIAALLPLGISQQDHHKVGLSPFGSSYGGLVFKGNPSYKESLEIIQLLTAYLREVGVHKFTTTLPLRNHYPVYSETFRFCLLEQGFENSNVDICSIVPLHRSVSFNSRVKRNQKKAKALGINICMQGNTQDFWKVLSKTFEKLGVRPTHTLDEWVRLTGLYPKRIFSSVAYLGDVPVAALGHMIINKNVLQAFYICSDPNYKETQALTLLIAESINWAIENNFNYYDFGTSSLKMNALPNLFEFKESFGAIGFSREQFTITLQ